MLRRPKLGEQLICGACHSKCDTVDIEYIKLYDDLLNKYGEDAMKNNNGLYDEIHDQYFSYDGCEDVTVTQEDMEHYLKR